MSMIARFVQVTPEVLKQYLEDPSDIVELFEDEAVHHAGTSVSPSTIHEALKTPAAMQQAPRMLSATLERLDPVLREDVKKLASLGFDPDAPDTPQKAADLVKLMAQRTTGTTVAQAGRQAPSGPSAARSVASISLDKAWHGIHYLLCGNVEPGSSMLSRAVMGGSELGDDDSGYGPARYFSPEEVAQLAGEMTRADLEREMRARFNPAAMTREGIYPSSSWAPPDREWLMEEFRRLRDFYAAAASHGYAVMTCIV